MSGNFFFIKIKLKALDIVYSSKHPMKFTLLFIIIISFFSCQKKNAPEIKPPVVDNCGGRYENEIFTSVKTSSDVAYGKALNISGVQENLYLDIYEPLNDTASKRPMVLFVHGGAWTDGTKMQGRDFCSFFAKRGYVTASIDYRLGIEMPLNEKTRGEAVYRGVQDIKLQ